jgi:hypothetical protein
MDEARTCAKCGLQPSGEGGILCPNCLTLLTENADNFWRDHPQVTEPAAARPHAGPPELASYRESE